MQLLIVLQINTYVTFIIRSTTISVLKYQITYDYVRLVLWTEDFSIEMGLDPAPVQLEHITTNRSRNHHITHLGQYGAAGRQAR